MAFHLHRNGTSTVFELATLRDMARTGELPQDEYVYVDEKGEWLPAGQVPEMTGAWNIEENEATVAVQLTPDLMASMEAAVRAEAAKKAAAAQKTADDAAHSAPLVVAPSAPAALNAYVEKAETQSDQGPDSSVSATVRPATGALPRQKLPEPPAHDAENEATAFMQLPPEMLAPPPTSRPGFGADAEDDQPTKFMSAVPEELIRRPAPRAQRRSEITDTHVDPPSALPGNPSASPLANSANSQGNALVSNRQQQTTLLLSVALGIFGADRFYLGYTGLGVAKLLTLVGPLIWLAIDLGYTGLGVAKLLTLGGALIWWVVDVILIATGKMKDAQGRALKP